jgi:prepilin signal peptidase PulO-like enzyme (type II secretory pathway)
MTAEQVFKIVNIVAAAGWLILIVGARARRMASLMTATILPLLFAVLYGCLIATHWSERTGGFGTLAEVRALFSNDWLLLAGWVHYLAFDLFVGSWQVRDAQTHRIPHLLLVPGLVLTFLFGPIGFLLYYVVRLLHGAGRRNIVKSVA